MAILNHNALAIIFTVASFFFLGCHSGEDLGGSASCFPKDREALLSFKKGIEEDTTGILSSWTDSNCCGAWEGVECNSRTGRVTTLLLQYTGETNKSLYMRGTLSPSLGNLNFLEVLVIHDMKYIQGTIPVSIAALSHLTQLYIENSQLQGSIPSEFGRLPRLEALSLSGNRLSGPVPATLAEIHSLVQLNVGNNRLSGRLPPSLARLGRLQYLDIAGNFMSGPVPDSLGSLYNITYLDLSRNFFSGFIPPSLANLSNILDLNLAGNRFRGRIPPSLGRISSLSSLSLSHNFLVGSIPPSLSNFSNLWYLNLSHNHLSDPLPATLANTSALICLDLSYNNLHLGKIPDWITRKEMRNLHLADCGVQQSLSEWHPRAMSPLLTSIDLSDNNLTGDITHLLRNMTSLERVFFSNNNLSSNLSKLSLPDSITTLDLHSNGIYGTVDSIFSDNVSEACSIQGGCLEFVRLGNNKITGKLPEIRIEQGVKWLDLSGNRLRGVIPASILMLKRVERLDFSGNRLVSKIPGTVGALKELRWLDLAGNLLKGRIPAQILGLKHLKHLNLRNNRLCGEIPQGRPLNIFPAYIYGLNDCLCGTPLPRCKKML